MTLTELQSEVYTLTNRPDLTAETLAAVRAATLKLHQLEYFFKDIFETGVTFSASAYQQQIDYRTLIPAFRSVSYIRKTDSTGSDDLGFFDVIQPESVLDLYQQNREDVYYVAGQMIQLRSSTQFQYIILGCYINPDITVAGYNSWIALDHPYAIIYQAAADIFKAIGKSEEFAAYTAMALDQRQAVTISNIQAKGY